MGTQDKQRHTTMQDRRAGGRAGGRALNQWFYLSLHQYHIMTLYSKWQRLNVLDTVGEFVFELIEEPWSRGMMLLIAQIFYVLILWSTVKFLRKESIKDEQ